MDCEAANTLIMKYMDDVLTDTEAKQLSKHAESCPKCAEDFRMYAQILDDLTGAELLEAPEGFESLVMEKIRELPDISLQTESSTDNMVYAIWGAFSVLFGIGFLGAVNSAAIMEYFYSRPELSGFATALNAASEWVARFSTGFVSITGQFATDAAGLVASSRYVLLVAFAVLAIIQYVIYQRGKVEV